MNLIMQERDSDLDPMVVKHGLYCYSGMKFYDFFWQNKYILVLTVRFWGGSTEILPSTLLNV